MNNWKYVVNMLMCFALVSIVFGGCATNSNNSQNETELSTYENEKVFIPRTLNFDKEKSVEIELPEIALSGIKGTNKEDRINEFRENLQEQDVYFEDIYLNDVGCIILLCDEEQYNAYIGFLENKIQGAMNTEIEVTINDEFTHICYVITDD